MESKSETAVLQNKVSPAPTIGIRGTSPCVGEPNDEMNSFQRSTICPRRRNESKLSLKHGILRTPQPCLRFKVLGRSVCRAAARRILFLGARSKARVDRYRKISSSPRGLGKLDFNESWFAEPTTSDSPEVQSTRHSEGMGLSETTQSVATND